MLGVAGVSTAAPLIKVIAAPSLVIAFWRLAFASIVTLPFALALHRREIKSMTRRELGLATLAGIFLGAHFAFFISSLGLTSVASAVAIVTMQPIWATLFALVRGERIPALAWAGMAMSFVGVLVLSGVDLSVTSTAVIGNGLALVGGMLAAAHRIVGAQVRRTLSTTAYTSICYPTGAAVSLLVCGASRQPLIGYAGSTWIGFFMLAVLAQLLGHSVFSHVLKATSPTIVSLALMFEVVGASLLAWMLLGEVPPPRAIPAVVLLVAGVMLVVRQGGRQVAVVLPTLD